MSCQTRCRTPTPQGLLRVRRTKQPLNGALAFLGPKDSRRRVPLTAATTALLRDYLDAARPADADAMAALGAMGRPAHAGNVIRLRG